MRKNIIEAIKQIEKESKDYQKEKLFMKYCETIRNWLDTMKGGVYVYSDIGYGVKKNIISHAYIGIELSRYRIKVKDFRVLFFDRDKERFMKDLLKIIDEIEKTLKFLKSFNFD